MAIWEKLFSKITFKNYPDTSTPLNASNMNALSDAIDGIDDRVVELNSKLGNVKSINLYTRTAVRNTTYTNLVQFTIPNASSKKIFVTPSGSDVTLPSYITRINIIEQTVQLVFKEALVDGVEYTFDVLAIEI